MKVPYLALDRQWKDIRIEALPLIDEVLSTGKYLDHDIVWSLESQLSDQIGVDHTVLVNSGTDALMFGLYALGIGRGDEVITVPNSFIASVAAIQHVGATPIMVDVGQDHLMDVTKLESVITSKTRAIMPVHLEGKVCDMHQIMNIAKKYGLFVIEDVAQAFGSKLSGEMAGSFSDVSCFSLHPLKNLNACGDGGFVATNNTEIADRIKSLRNHGQAERNHSSEFGFVSRFDSLQAAILHIRLKGLTQVISRRRENAKLYNSAFENSRITIPIIQNQVFHTYHTYVIEIDRRDEVKEQLALVGVDTRIHYPNLITDQAAFTRKFGEQSGRIPTAIMQKGKVLSLPIHAHLTDEEIQFVANQILAC